MEKENNGVTRDTVSDEPVCRLHSTAGKDMSHFHRNEQGELIKCFHECKSVVRQPSFWILTTLTFPIEHGIWSLVYHLFGWNH